MRVLGIESSCDETAASVVVDGVHVESSIVSSQIDLHIPYGGVVPEIAGRAHIQRINGVVREALSAASLPTTGQGIDAVACTVGPGLIGALLVGVSHAKALAWMWDVPFLPVNHLEAHLYSPFLEGVSLEFPLITLLVSGGHTVLLLLKSPTEYEVLGGTIDDAAGEAYDKVARFLDLGYPGGPAIDKLAPSGDPTRVAFPRGMRGEGYDFSFSGVKTSVVNFVRNNPDVSSADIAACFQTAVVDVLVEKTIRAAVAHNATGVCIGGGVAANSALRASMAAAADMRGLTCFLPSRSMCTDNAAMVAAAAWWRRDVVGPAPLDIGANPALRLHGYGIQKGRIKR
jgi:N6-L-threonylcarbamoyladenine synthase